MGSSVESGRACTAPATLFCSGGRCYIQLISDDCSSRQTFNGESQRGESHVLSRVRKTNTGGRIILSVLRNACGRETCRRG